ncbi:MAG TPA: helix-turn-helix transcriptional regulator [Acetobacteraceae bacterium]|nr:helix-turn-helix transcriptional regulator [Acetobacteraceae bacterium]
MAVVTNPLAGRKGQERGDRGHDVGFDNRRIVGDHMAALRTQRGLTQLELGRSLGMRDTAVSAIELGRNSLPPERYAEMADALGADRKTFGRFLLRWYNPWLFAMIFPEEISEQEVRELPERMVDHRKTA